MNAPIDFYFDFSSPYGYFTSTRIDALAARHGRTVCWRPYLMGAVFKITGRKALVEQPLVREYAKHDLARTARLHDVPFRIPQPFPVATIAACRAFYALRDAGGGGSGGEAQAVALARALFHAYFAEGRNISEAPLVLEIAKESGLDAEALAAALSDPAVKERLRHETEAAVERKVFGSPFVIVDGEAFWGDDRLHQVERWLQTGGW